MNLDAVHYEFTSALSVQLLKSLALVLNFHVDVTACEDGFLL